MTADDDIALFSGKKPEAKKQVHEVLIFEEFYDAFLFFDKLWTQWNRVTGLESTKLTGLSYPAVESMMRILKVKDRADMFQKIQIMEARYLELDRG